VVAVVAAPALTGLGVPLLTAHLILFWLSQTSNVTPPIALAAFAGAGVAGGRPMPTAFQAVRLAAGLFMVPLLMAYTPLLPGAVEPLGPAQGVAFVGGLVAMAAVALALYGHGVRAVSWPVRLLLAAGALLLLFPDPLLRLAGAGLAALGFLPQFRGRRS